MANDTQVLDLDVLLPPKKTLKLFNKEHEVKQITTHLYLESQKIRKANLSDENNIEDNINAMIDFVQLFIPTLTKDDLGELSLQQLNVIIDFINKQADDANKQAMPDSVKQDAKGKAKKGK